MVGQIERESAQEYFGTVFEELMAHATASVLLAVAGLEAFTNELFVDRDQYLPNVSAELSAQLWKKYRRSPVLEKVDVALLLRNCAQLDRASPPVDDVDCLIALRNALTHFRPEWEPDWHAALSGRLSGRFSPTPFLGDSELIFPRRWASHGCTVWALNSIVQLLRVVEPCFPVPGRVESFVDRLKG
jgi:hypothetical protein